MPGNAPLLFRGADDRINTSFINFIELKYIREYATTPAILF